MVKLMFVFVLFCGLAIMPSNVVGKNPCDYVDKICAASEDLDLCAYDGTTYTTFETTCDFIKANCEYYTQNSGSELTVTSKGSPCE